MVAVGIPANTDVQWNGSGFLFGYPDGGTNSESGAKTYQLWLVSNRHVLSGLAEVVLGFNPESGTTGINLLCPLIDKGRNIVHYHLEGDADPVKSSVDVAVAPIRWERLARQAINFSCFRADEDAANFVKLKDLQLSEGDSVFVMGYPLGLTTAENDSKGVHYPIVRAGIVARLRDYFETKSTTFLIDTANFPGNSGGPVVVKPEMVSVEGIPAQIEPLLIGLVSAYRPHLNQLSKISFAGDPISLYQTKNGTLTEDANLGELIYTMENSGLAVVQPIQAVIDLILSYPYLDIGIDDT